MEQNASQPMTTPPPAERVWTVVTARQNPITGAVEADPAALGVALAELQGILLRLGGVVQFATRRQQLDDGRVETLAVVVRWRSFSPVDRAQQAPPVEQDGTEAQAAADSRETPPDIGDEAWVDASEEHAPITHESVLPAAEVAP
jgi:hypothetical protein